MKLWRSRTMLSLRCGFCHFYGAFIFSFNAQKSKNAGGLCSSWSFIPSFFCTFFFVILLRIVLIWKKEEARSSWIHLLIKRCEGLKRSLILPAKRRSFEIYLNFPCFFTRRKCHKITATLVKEVTVHTQTYHPTSTKAAFIQKMPHFAIMEGEISVRELHKVHPIWRILFANTQ